MTSTRMLGLVLGCAALASPSFAEDCASRCEAAPVATSGLVTIQVERELCLRRPQSPEGLRLDLFPKCRGDRYSWPGRTDLFSWTDLLPFHTVTARGAGFVAREDGLIVTAAALVAALDSSQRVMVSLADGRRLPAELVGSDTDLALLRVEASGLTTGSMAMSAAEAQRAELTVGSTTGVLGAMEPEREGAALMAWVSRPASVRPGAPLLTKDGQVVGVSTSVTPIEVPFFGPCVGIASVVPVERVRELIDRSLPETKLPSQSLFDLDLDRWFKPWFSEPVQSPAEQPTRE